MNDRMKITHLALVLGVAMGASTARAQLGDAEPPPFDLACGSASEIIGWTPDENTVAYWQTSFVTDLDGEAIDGAVCPGHLDPSGNPVSARVNLCVVGAGFVKRTTVIERPAMNDEGKVDPTTCQSVDEIKANYASAREELKTKIGIVVGKTRGEALEVMREKHGGAIKWTMPGPKGPRAMRANDWNAPRRKNPEQVEALREMPPDVRAEILSDQPDFEYLDASGTLVEEATIAIRESKTVLQRFKFTHETDGAEADQVTPSSYSVELTGGLRSPSGKTVLLFARDRYGWMRGAETASFLLARVTASKSTKAVKIDHQ